MSALTAVTTNRPNNSIEFVVVPKDDLYLEGGIRKLFRVAKASAYPCQMQKTQNFSCLFRHYAKHNGLRKEDLVFYFTDELQQDQTPESVHLMPQDEIWVEHRKPVEVETKKQVAPNVFSEHLRKLLKDNSHYDVTFRIGPDSSLVHGHKAILSARSEYFEAMFRKDGLSESSKSIVDLHGHDLSTFKRVMEYIYTNSIVDLGTCDSEELMALLIIACEYVLDDLKEYCSSAVERVLREDNIGKFMSLCSCHGISDIRDLCIRFVRLHHATLRQNQSFCGEVEQNPELGLLLLDALPIPGSLSDHNVHGQDVILGLKRARIDESSSEQSHQIPSQTQSMNANTIQNNSFTADGM